jgi:hypothetical protein
MELIITPTQALFPLSVIFVLYHAVRAWFLRKPESKHWDELPSVGVNKQQWFAWVWATLKSVRWTQDWAFEGYRKVREKLRVWRMSCTMCIVTLITVTS